MLHILHLIHSRHHRIIPHGMSARLSTGVKPYRVGLSHAWMTTLRICALVIFSIIAQAAVPATVRAAELYMMETAGCHYCIRWKEEIAPIYPKTAAGQFAPLVLHDIDAPLPTHVHLARKVVFTPTFVLLENGQELGRIEGYPGEDFFWGLLEAMLVAKTAFSIQNGS